MLPIVHTKTVNTFSMALLKCRSFASSHQRFRPRSYKWIGSLSLPAAARQDGWTKSPAAAWCPKVAADVQKQLPGKVIWIRPDSCAL
jgi:hypothetical protein